MRAEKLSWQKRKDQLKRDLCNIIIRIGALQFGAFTLPSGRLTPYYIDLRLIPSFPDAFKKIMNMYVEMAKNDIGIKNFERVAGIPTAGIPFSSVLSYLLSKPFLYVRKELKAIGRERRVEGMLNPGDHILLTDDLISTGGNLTAATKALRSEGGLIKDAFVLIDREEGGELALADIKVKLRSLVKISEAARIMCDMETITKEQLDSILKQTKAFTRLKA